MNFVILTRTGTFAVASLALFLAMGCGASKPSASGSPTSSPTTSTETKPTVAGTVPFTEKELGFKFYPGSTPVDHGSMTMKMNGKNVYSYTAETTDELAKISDFYRTQAEGAYELGKPESGLVVFSGKTADGRAYQVTLADQKKTHNRMVHVMMTGDPKP